MPHELGGLLGELSKLLKECAQADQEAQGMRLAARRAQRARADIRALAVRYVVSNPGKLRAVRQRVGVPQKAIALTARVCQAYVSYLEAGKVTCFSQATLVRMLQAYGEL
jgi:hypothetical protein